MNKVALVIGHSKLKQGSRSALTKMSEWEINQKVVHDLAARLIKSRKVIPCIIYRESTYAQLPKEINAHKCDLVISHHVNSFGNNQAQGTEVLYYYRSKKSKYIAIRFNALIRTALGTRSRGAKPRRDGQRGTPVLRDTDKPCVLLEPFFMSNPNDIRKFKDNYARYIDGLEKAINEAFNFLKER